MATNRKEQICTLLKGIETGDPSAVSVVNEEKYIQHNPQTHEGSEGLATLFKRLSKTSPRVNIVRIFEDGDFIFGHTEYDFVTRNIGFEIFRFENEQAVEHWDNIQLRQGPNISGHSMVDGTIEITDNDKTESNRLVIQSFVENVLLNRTQEGLNEYISQEEYIEHSPNCGDDLIQIQAMLFDPNDGSSNSINYDKLHRLLAEGNFVLSVCEGYANRIPSSFFDLYRLKEGKIVEHWGTTEAIPTQSEWKNNNGKF
jgi:predicted SnoaL-like aldol condensation-catalyzing enzyme